MPRESNRTTQPPNRTAVRIQKVIAASGLVSRRAAEALMQEGRVTVNGVTVREMGTRVVPEQDDVRVDGSRVRLPREHRYLVLHKPRGYVTTRSDPEHRPTILDLIKPTRDVYPVGRLDYDSEGLVLLTNDGELAARLMHPRHGIERVYEARVRGVPDARDLARFARGLVIDGRRTGPTSVRLAATGRGLHHDQSLVEVTLTEGRTRQVRKMLDAIGHPVVRLRRVRFGPLLASGLKAGQFRSLTEVEITRLKNAVGLP